jgi:predicted AlkP superfamily phosphohydrolase/phosphomutase
VITGTDRLMHFLWSTYENKNHPYNQAFLDYFDKVDRFIGRFYNRFLGLGGSIRGKNQFYMLSDHGFTKIKTEVYLNCWLQEHGFLKFNNDQPETIIDIGLGSTAFALDPSRIYVNLKDKYPLGVVDYSDYNRVRRELKDGPEALTFDNVNHVVRNVYFKEELYNGPYLKQAPDLVVISAYGYDLKGKINSPEVFDRTDLEGMHTQDDAFFFNTTGKECKSIFETKQVIADSLVS